MGLFHVKQSGCFIWNSGSVKQCQMNQWVGWNRLSITNKTPPTGKWLFRWCLTPFFVSHETSISPNVARLFYMKQFLFHIRLLNFSVLWHSFYTIQCSWDITVICKQLFAICQAVKDTWQLWCKNYWKSDPPPMPRNEVNSPFCRIFKRWFIGWTTGQNIQRLLFWHHSYEVTLNTIFPKECIIQGSILFMNKYNKVIE